MTVNAINTWANLDRQPQQLAETIRLYAPQTYALIKESEGVLAAGFWCANCEYFEVDDMTEDRCMACGCSVADHHSVVVIDADQIKGRADE